MARDNDNNHFLTGALLGSVIGSVAGLLVAPKSGKELREEIADGYCKFSDKTCDLAEQIKETGQSFMHPFAEEKDESSPASSLLIGGAIGSLLGATAAFTLAPKSGAKLRKQIGEKYEAVRETAEDQVDDWKETLSSIVDKFADIKGSKRQSRVEQIADWASLGIRLLQQVQKRR